MSNSLAAIMAREGMGAVDGKLLGSIFIVDLRRVFHL